MVFTETGWRRVRRWSCIPKRWRRNIIDVRDEVRVFQCGVIRNLNRGRKYVRRLDKFSFFVTLYGSVNTFYYCFLQQRRLNCVNRFLRRDKWAKLSANVLNVTFAKLTQRVLLSQWTQRTSQNQFYGLSDTMEVDWRVNLQNKELSQKPKCSWNFLTSRVYAWCLFRCVLVQIKKEENFDWRSVFEAEFLLRSNHTYLRRRKRLKHLTHSHLK